MNATKTNKIIIRNDGWGEAIIENILAVLTSSIQLFENNIEPVNFNNKLTVVQNSNLHTPPIDHPKMYKMEPENLIFLSVEGRFWSKYAYQFSHEYCHHLIESDFINSFDQFGWFEESLCELASIHSLKTMAHNWIISPPYTNWKSYALSLNDYADEILNRQSNKIDYSLSTWIDENIKDLSTDRYQREKNCLIAKNISNIFFSDPTLWNTVTYINKIELTESMNFKEFLNQWQLFIPEQNIKSWSILKNKLLN